jgi:lysophospholipase L1-like esterase
MIRQLNARTSAVSLIPTGFAVRPLTGPPPASGQATTPSPGAASAGTPAAASVRTPGLSGTAPDSTLPDGWQSRDLDRWLLRWTPTPRQVRTAAANEEWVRMGPLATLAAIRMSARQAPRFVTPDGACTVYLVPFLSGPAGRNNTVAVIGDSLVGQVSAPNDSSGALLSRLTAKGQRAEISGQGGRRFSVKPDGLTSFEQADSTMLDELRGVRGARSVVVALGTNDAGWVAHASNREQYELRLSWAMTQIEDIVDELQDHGHCTVLVTMAQRNKSYSGSRAGTFDHAAGRINEYLRRRAEADPKHRLRLWDWGTHADAHGTADPQPWFGHDTIHLRHSGRAHYADELTAAAALC